MVTPVVLAHLRDGSVDGDVVLAEVRKVTADPALLRALA